jgi:hypothetical protein
MTPAGSRPATQVMNSGRQFSVNIINILLSSPFQSSSEQKSRFVMLFGGSNGSQKELNRKWSAYKHLYNKKFNICSGETDRPVRSDCCDGAMAVRRFHVRLLCHCP